MENAFFEAPAVKRLQKHAVAQATQELSNTHLQLQDDGDQPHRYDLQLFGENHSAFLAKQYKSA